jgi:polyisoprenoid-binding protein YceI
MKLSVLLFVVLPNIGFAAVSLEPAGGMVEVVAIGKPSFLKINGKGEAPKGKIRVNGKKLSGKLDFNLNTLDTGIGLRNHHMKEKYLEVGKHPQASLEIPEQDLPAEFDPEHPEMREGEFKGRLTLHGVTKAVMGTFAVSEDSDVAANFKIKLSDYAIDIPKYAGITIADEVDVNVKIESLEER